jgi:hypothetical protein
MFTKLMLCLTFQIPEVTARLLQMSSCNTLYACSCAPLPSGQACLRLKGENGIMRKKFQALQKDIEEQREQLSLQHEQQKELYTTIKGACTAPTTLACCPAEMLPHCISPVHGPDTTADPLCLRAASLVQGAVAAVCLTTAIFHLLLAGRS